MGFSSRETKDFMSKIGESTSSEMLGSTSSEMLGNDDRGKKPVSNNDLSDQLGSIHLLERNHPVNARRKFSWIQGKDTSNCKRDRLSNHAISVLGGTGARTRPPSLLEQSLLPGFRNGPNPLSGSESSQLTMFYAGTVNVYENVSFEKAQAIMLLAGESSTSSPRPGIVLQPEENLMPSSSKVEVGLRIARRNSLSNFLKKRQDRMINKTSYGAAIGERLLPRRIQATSKAVEAPNDDGNPPLSPFPSRLGYFSPVPATNGSQ